MSDFTIINGNCLDEMRKLPANSVDAIVCDPPYGIEFMGNKWDYEVPSVDVWRECLRVLKPGGHLLAFAGTRTQHRMAVNIEDAGFEIRDMIAWVYGSGFPKSLDVSKAIDKAAGAEREVVGRRVHPTLKNPAKAKSRAFHVESLDSAKDAESWGLTAPATDSAKQWDGWGTALKPAMEPITVARKPLIGTVAENVLRHGTGAINVDGCRVEADLENDANKRGYQGTNYVGGSPFAAGIHDEEKAIKREMPTKGRWPANIIHDGSEQVVSLFPQTGEGRFPSKQTTASWKMSSRGKALSPEREMGDSGSAVRFFYCAKTSKADRGEGNDHPTVKPTELMRYLVRLVCAKGGTVLDPFMGSGSTGKGALLEDCKFIGIDLNADYCKVADKRLTYVVKSKPASLEGLFG